MSLPLCACGCGHRVRAPLSRFLRGHHHRCPDRIFDTPATTICACGCGKVIPPRRTHKYQRSRYLAGHATRCGPPRRTYKPTTDEMPSGLCECGCGKATAIATITLSKRRHFRGYPRPYVQTHEKRPPGKGHHLWQGGRFVHRAGYVYVSAPDHPHRNAVGYVYEHRLVMEQVLGRHLKKHERVHHINGDKADNRPANLELTNGNHGPGVCLYCGDCGSSNVIPGKLKPGLTRWIRHKAYMPQGK